MSTISSMILDSTDPPMFVRPCHEVSNFVVYLLFFLMMLPPFLSTNHFIDYISSLSHILDPLIQPDALAYADRRHGLVLKNVSYGQKSLLCLICSILQSNPMLYIAQIGTMGFCSMPFFMDNKEHNRRLDKITLRLST